MRFRANVRDFFDPALGGTATEGQSDGKRSDSRKGLHIGLSPKWQDKSGDVLYADFMMELEWEVGEWPKKLDELPVADNSIVIFTSDKCAEIFSRPEGGNPVPAPEGSGERRSGLEYSSGHG